MAKIKKVNPNRQEILRLQGLIKSENESLDLTSFGGLSSAKTKMISHLEEKTKYLLKYSEILRDACAEDISIGIFDGFIVEVRDIKQRLRATMKSSLADPSDEITHRQWVNYYSNITNIALMDLVNRLHRVERILDVAYLKTLKKDN